MYACTCTYVRACVCFASKENSFPRYPLADPSASKLECRRQIPAHVYMSVCVPYLLTLAFNFLERLLRAWPYTCVYETTRAGIYSSLINSPPAACLICGIYDDPVTYMDSPSPRIYAYWRLYTNAFPNEKSNAFCTIVIGSENVVLQNY